MIRGVALVVLVLAGGCPAAEPEGETGGVEEQAPQGPPEAVAPRDAGVAAHDAAVSGSAAASGSAAEGDPGEPRPEYDLSEFHLDEVTGAHEDYRPPTRRRPAREARLIHITLRTTPPGAIAAVDGEVVGRTPAFWEGEVTGAPREFTFVLPGYAMARYRFVPVTSGVVHGRLAELAAPEPDAGPTADAAP